MPPSRLPVRVARANRRNQRYPQDQASGCTIGDLRGAVWAEREVVEGAR